MYLIHPHHSILDLKELKDYLNGMIIGNHRCFHENLLGCTAAIFNRFPNQQLQLVLMLLLLSLNR